LGSGKSYNNDYLNVDITETFWQGETYKPDLLADMRTLDFPENTFIEVKAHDCLDHIEYTECKALLPRIYKWLKPNGILNIHLPNLRFLAGILAFQDMHHAILWLYGTDGSENWYPSNKIRWCYSKASMAALLNDVGFIIGEVGEDCGGFAFHLVAVKR
jgi:predicted SAM-dependent methyltransferase